MIERANHDWQIHDACLTYGQIREAANHFYLNKDKNYVTGIRHEGFKAEVYTPEKIIRILRAK